MDFVDAVQSLRVNKDQQSGLIVKRINQKYTISILVICSILITYNQIKEPISCNKYTNS